MQGYRLIAFCVLSLGLALGLLVKFTRPQTRWLATPSDAPSATAAETETDSDPRHRPPDSRPASVQWGGGYTHSTPPVSSEEGQAHYELGGKLLEFGDYYSAASHLAMARDALGDYRQVCKLLAIAYDKLNMVVDLMEIMPCLERHAQDGSVPWPYYDRLRRQLDVEGEFRAAATDHFVASFPAVGPAADGIGQVLDVFERARHRTEVRIGLASMRLVPIVVYQGDQFDAATEKPHWAKGLYDGKIRVSIESFRENRDFFEMAAAHEYVHALTYEYTGLRLPSWFREGLADNLARTKLVPEKSVAELADEGALLDIDDLSQDFLQLSADQVKGAYLQSYWMTHQLVEEAGWGAIEDLLRDLHAHPQREFDESFSDRFGESPAAYFERWYDENIP